MRISDWSSDVCSSDLFVKAIMSRGDVLADVETLPPELADKGWKTLKEARYAMKMPPLLVLYPIYRDSQPSSSGREPMAAAADVLGFGIVFPGKPGSGTVYVQADIPPLESEADRLEERRVGKECVSTWRSRWVEHNLKQKTI